MAKLLVLKEQILAFWVKNEKITKPIGRFLIAFVLMLAINSKLTFFPILNNIIADAVIALVSAFLPVNFITLFAGLAVVLNLYKVSLELAVIVGVLALIMVFFNIKFSAKVVCLLLLLPAAYILKIPYAICIAAGLVGSATSLIPLMADIIICNIVEYTSLNASALVKLSSLSMTERFQAIAQRIFTRPELLSALAASFVTMIIVMVIRKRSIDRAWLIAVISGSAVNTMIMLAWSLVINKSDNIIILVIGEAVSCCIGLVLQFMAFSVDYTRVERLQFEDDEYYYYVKAVPKVSVSALDVKIKRFTKTKPVEEGTPLESIVSEGLSELSDEAFLNEFEDEIRNDTTSQEQE